MVIRIKYHKIHDGLVSSSINHIDKSYKVKIDWLHMHFIIYDAITNDVVISGGKASNRKVLMRQARKALSKLGVELGKEKRRVNAKQ